MQEITIYLALGSLQLLAAERLIQSSGGRALLINATAMEYVSSGDCQVFELAKSGALANLRNYRALSSKLAQVRQRYEVVNVAVPHLYHLIANHLVHRVRTKTLICLPDGALNFIPLEVTSFHRKVMRKKKIVGKFTGFDYQQYQGRLMGFTGLKVDRVASFFSAEYFPEADEFEMLSLPRGKACNKDVCLVLDQRLGSVVMDEASAKLIRRKILDFTSSSQFVYGKLHPTQVSPDLAALAGSIRWLRRERPVEDVVEGIQPGTVVSVTSSALITLKIMNPDTHCVSVGLNRVEAVRSEFRSLRAVYHDLGILCIDV